MSFDPSTAFTPAPGTVGSLTVPGTPAPGTVGIPTTPGTPAPVTVSTLTVPGTPDSGPVGVPVPLARDRRTFDEAGAVELDENDQPTLSEPHFPTSP
jgi:hypothetical protein